MEIPKTIPMQTKMAKYKPATWLPKKNMMSFKHKNSKSGKNVL